MDAIATMLQAVARDPGDDTAWLALADCLAEAGQESRAELLRVQLALRQRDVPDADRLERRLHELWSVGVPPCLPFLRNRFGMEFIQVPPGSFWRGAVNDERWLDHDELPRRRVTLTRGFYLGATPVTLNHWRALLMHLPAQPDHSRNLPVVLVSRLQAEEFCQRLSEDLGGAAACRRRPSGSTPAGRARRTHVLLGRDVEALRQVGWCSYDGDMGQPRRTQAGRAA